jgi:hypothetical protein
VALGCVLLLVAIALIVHPLGKAQSAPPPPAAVGVVNAAQPAPSQVTAMHPASRPSSAPRALQEPTGQPSRVAVPNRGIDAPLEPIVLQPDHTLVPDFGIAGWYAQPGWDILPGFPGPSVLAGHIDNRQGLDTFGYLPEVRPGDLVRVSYTSGEIVTFRVTATERIQKADLPTDTIWTHDTRPVLRLITCFPDAKTFKHGHYRDNYVVWADEEVSISR